VIIIIFLLYCHLAVCFDSFNMILFLQIPAEAKLLIVLLYIVLSLSNHTTVYISISPLKTYWSILLSVPHKSLYILTFFRTLHVYLFLYEVTKD